MYEFGFGYGFDKIRRSSGAPTPTPTPTPIARMVTEGDSITYDTVTPFYYPPDAERSGSYARAFAADNPSITVTNPAVTSASVGFSSDAPGTNSLWGRKATLLAANPEVVTIYIGSNDMVFATTIDGSGPASTDWITRLWAYVAYVRANVPGVKIFIGGLLPVDPARWPNGVGAGNTFNTRRASINATLRAAVGNQIDGYIPFGDTLPDSWAATSGNLYDGLHPDSEGRRHMSRVYNAVMIPAAAGIVSGNVPTAFNLTNQANVTAGATATASMIVTGMGVGQTCTASVSGGLIRRDTGSFGAGPLTVMNGDIVEVQVTASATAGATVSATLTVGTRSDVFTVQTAVATEVEFEHSTDSRTTYNSASGSTATFTNVTFPAGRPVLLVKKQYFDETSVTINGVDAERVGFDRTAQMSVWVGPPSQSLTAGQQVTVVSSGGFATSTYALWPGAIRNCDQPVSDMAVRWLPYFYQWSGYRVQGPVLELQSGDITLFAHHGINTSFLSFINGVVVHAYAAVASYLARWGTSKVSGAPTVFQAGNNNAAIMVALEKTRARVAISSRFVTDAATTGTVVGTLSVPNGSGSYTYSITADPDAKFTIVGNELRVAAASVFNTARQHSVTISADNGTEVITKTFTIYAAEFVRDTFSGGTDAALIGGHTGELGATWSNGGVTGGGALRRSPTGTAYFSATGSGGLAKSSGIPMSRNGRVRGEVDFKAVAAGDFGMGVAGRIQPTNLTDNCYFGRYNDSSGGWQLGKIVSNTVTQIGTLVTAARPSGLVTVELVLNDDQISLVVNGSTVVGPVTDKSISAAGYAGIRGAGAVTSTTGQHLNSITAIAA